MGKLRLVVTGGAGFIGSNFVRYVVKNLGWKVLVYDKLTYAGRLENLREILNEIAFVRGDIADEEMFKKVVEEFQPNAIVNFAAESVAEDELVFIHYRGRIRLVSFKEFFEMFSRTCPVIKDGIHEIIDVSAKNIKVLSYYNGLGVFLPLRKIIRHYYKGKILRLRQKWGEVLVTPNHSVYDANGNLVNASSNPELLCIRRVNYYPHEHEFRNHVKTVPRGAGHLRVLIDKSYKDDKLEAIIKLLAAYISEGSVAYNEANGSYIIRISNKDRGWLEELAKDCQMISSGSCSIVKRKDRCYQLEINSKEFYEMCTKLCGVGAENKKVPDFIYGLDGKYQLLFWETLLKGDGNYREWKRNKTVEYTTTSRKLAAGISFILSLLGIEHTFYIRRPSNTKWDTSYTIRTRLFYNISTSEREIEEIMYEGYVYDLEVEGTHKFAVGVGNIVVHNTHVDRSINEPAPFIRTNVLGVFTILEVLKSLKHDVLLLHVSTDEVYGDLWGTDRYASEDDPLNPSSPYSASKASGDLLIKAYGRTYGTRYRIVRPSNNYGPYQHPEKLIPRSIIRLIHGKPPVIYGEGSQVRDWLHVEDTARAILTVLEKGSDHEIYNICGNMFATVREIVVKILKTMGKPEDFIIYGKPRPGEDRRYAMKCDKIRGLGWRPLIQLDQGLESTVKWYLENEWWWRSLVDERYVLADTPW